MRRARPRVAIRRVRGAGDPLWRALLEVYERAFEPPERENPADLVARLASRARPDGYIVVGARVGRRVVGGSIVAYLPAVRAGYVSYLFVDRAWRRQGVGTALLRRVRRLLAAQARAVGVRRMRGFFIEIRRRPEVGAREFWRAAGVFSFAIPWRYPRLRRFTTPVTTDLAFGTGSRARASWRTCGLARATRAIFAATYEHLPRAATIERRIIAALRRLPASRPVAYRDTGREPGAR